MVSEEGWRNAAGGNVLIIQLILSEKAATDMKVAKGNAELIAVNLHRISVAEAQEPNLLIVLSVVLKLGGFSIDWQSKTCIRQQSK